MSYNLEGSVWANNTITYAFTSTNLPQDPAMFDGNAMTAEEEQITQAALANWSSVANVHFVQVADSAQADIRIGLTTDGEDGLELGETTYTPFQDFQPDVRIGMVDPGPALLSDVGGVLTYHLAGEGQATFEHTADHAIAHATGLDHDYTDPAAIMSPSISSTTDPTLTTDDIAGAQALYGPAAGLNWVAGNGYYAVSVAAGATATIHDSNTTVFGGASNLVVSGGANMVVANGTASPGSLDVTSTSGSTQVWAGTGAVAEHLDGGHTQTILGATASQATTLTIDGGTASDTAEVDVWGQAGSTDTITQAGPSAVTLFGGLATTDYTGSNTTAVFNGSEPESGTIHSTGNDTVWAGSGRIDLYEGTTGDDVLVQGAGLTFIHGSTVAGASGTTTVYNLGGTGDLDYQGGTKAAIIQAGTGNLTLSGGLGDVVASIGAATRADLSFGATSGGAVIAGFDANRDSLTFGAGAVVGTSTASGSVSIALADGHSVLLQGVTSTHGLSLG